MPVEVRRSGPDIEQLHRLQWRDEPCASGSAPKNGPWFVSTMRARFGGFGALTAADSAMNAATVPIWSVGLKRRSKPIVVEGFELMDLPQSEPAT